MKLYIEFDFISGPFGGGNQFLKALKKVLARQGHYVDDPLRASVIIFNSHHLPEKVWTLKKLNKMATFIHRLDGPMRPFTSSTDKRDSIAYLMNSFADGVIFQSEYSYRGNIRQGLRVSVPHTIISNAPDPGIFYPSKLKKSSKRLSIVATSWSGNIKKGFDVYEWLDANLDFSRYEMTFIGNSPVKFKNITLIPPQPSEQLAEELRKRDVYITASINDPCSNALIEALNCGLVPIARNSGGHPEIVNDRSLLFDDASEILFMLNRIANNYERIRSGLRVQTIDDIVAQYCNFAEILLKIPRKELSKKDFNQTVITLKKTLGIANPSIFKRITEFIFKL